MISDQATDRGPAIRRVPLIALAAVSLFAGLWGGLLLLGLGLPSRGGDLAAMHGPLVVFGFLGTLVSLERAVALGRGWVYTAPLASAAGSLIALADPSGSLGPALLTFAGVVLAGAYVQVDRIQRSTHNAVMALGAVAWVAATVAWLTGLGIGEISYLMAGFLVLTIVGERLELSRAMNLTRAIRLQLLVAIGVFAAGLAISLESTQVGVAVAGAGLLGQAAWLARFDVARRTVKMEGGRKKGGQQENAQRKGNASVGLTRFMAVALLAGYAWMAVAGAIWLLGGGATWGFGYDAQLHAIYLGFVISMVFAHAPVIFPAVLRIPVPFRPRYYAHLALLHVSLVIRIVGGDLLRNESLWQLGGILNELAILLFLASTAAAAIASQRGNHRGPGR